MFITSIRKNALICSILKMIDYANEKVKKKELDDFSMKGATNDTEKINAILGLLSAFAVVAHMGYELYMYRKKQI